MQPTAYQTATPLADGRILYTVQDGDTLWKISAITGVPIDELERLNNISRDDPLQVGKVLILRIVTPTFAEPTLAFLPSATPSPLPVTGKGTICVSFFNDINGDGSQKADTETLVPGGQVSVALADGTEVGNHTLDSATDEFCFVDIPAGQYRIAAAAPKNYNPTGDMNKNSYSGAGRHGQDQFRGSDKRPRKAGRGWRRFQFTLAGVDRTGVARRRGVHGVHHDETSQDVALVETRPRPPKLHRQSPSCESSDRTRRWTGGEPLKTDALYSAY